MFTELKRSKTFLSHLTAYGASEVASKLSRLFVVIMVARQLGAEQIGLAAAALAVCDILKSLTENGIGQRVIAAAQSDLQAITARAHRLFWQTTTGLFLLQLCVAACFVWFGHAFIGALIALAALEYLFMPAGLVQAALAMREGKLKQTAAIAGTQIVSANLISVALVLVFPSALVLVLPRVLTAPIWLIAMRRLRPWSPDQSTPAPTGDFLSFGLPIIGTSLINALRLHADKLVIGALLGAQGLGAYFMAFNAGLSIAISFVAAFDKVVFPHLCKTDGQTARSIALMGIVMISPVVALQALFAPIYVPILLGPDWAFISPAVSILCLTAIPLTLWSAAAAELRVTGRSGLELAITFGATLTWLACAFPAATLGLTSLATTHLIVIATILGLASLHILFRRPSHFLMKQEV
ncbi:MAG: oligosaccharide flippase family protein [Cognatishimia sp.]|uniref:oligosaccharide flippase family protein n=1 Tax=Cognatishimia sp. TaxID=2211648 RepID=UPI003B8B1DF0